MTTFHCTDETEIKTLLMGRTVTKVTDDTLTLDDGRTLEIVGNDGCGGCVNGHYSITELNDCPNNAIMNVEFSDDDETFQLFVYAEDTRIKLLQVEGTDSGYYGSGYYITVTQP